MSFVTPAFFLFLPAVLLLWRLLPGRYRWVLLLLASYFFYAWHNVWLLGLILLTTLTSYGCALGMEGAKTPRGRRLWVVLTAVVCLGVLVVFKYLDLLVGGLFALGRLLGGQARFDGFHLLLPMGISFYVFQTMSYTFDVYAGTVRAEHHLGYYALFVAFFPQLVAGPIERPGDLLPQLRAPRAPTADDVLHALKLLLRGYAKKVLIADYLAMLVDTAYGDPAAAGGAALAVATALFAVQIYCDFSGYSDIALGVAALLGVKLSENFRRPYAALTLRDFWRRWHISLTRWFTDYLYIPLGGSRGGKWRTRRNILIVFLVSGLWHGADVTFIIWGGLHGLFLVLESMLFREREPLSPVPRLLRRLLTLAAVCFAWVFFRSPDLDSALLVLGQIFTAFRPRDLLSGLGATAPQLLTAALLTALLPLVEALPALPAAAHTPSERSRCAQAALGYLLLTAAVCICRCLILSQGGGTAFLYFQF